MPANVIGNCVSALNNLAPYFEVTLDNLEVGGGKQNIECKGSSGEFPLVEAVAAELDNWLVVVGDDIRAAEAG